MGGVLKFKNHQTTIVLDSVKLSRSKYEELNAKERNHSKTSEPNASQERNELAETENKIKDVERGIEVADKTIKYGSDKLTCDLNHRPLNQERLQYDNQMIQMGLRREKKLTEDLSKLMTKKAKLLKLKK